MDFETLRVGHLLAVFFDDARPRRVPRLGAARERTTFDFLPRFEAGRKQLVVTFKCRLFAAAAQKEVLGHVVAVKVIDIFGNDTMTLVPLTVA